MCRPQVPGHWSQAAAHAAGGKSRIHTAPGWALAQGRMWPPGTRAAVELGARVLAGVGLSVHAVHVFGKRGRCQLYVSSEVWPEAWAPACLGLSWAVPEWGLACTCVCEHPGLSPTSLWSCLWARGQGVPPLEPVLGTCAVSDTKGLPGPSIHQRWRLCEHPFRGWGTRLYRADSAEASGPWCWSALPSEQELTRALPPLTLAVKWAWPSPGARP